MPKSTNQSDANLVKQFQNGDAMVLNILVERWHKKMCQKAYWILKDSDLAKDIAQDSWSTIITKLHSLKSVSSFGSWVLRITTNKALDKVRQQSKLRFKGEIEIPYLEINEENDNGKSVLREKVLKTINKLSIEHQQVLRLFYVEDYSLKEIGHLLKISEGTVKSRLYHSREKLKTIFKDKIT